MPDFYAAAKHLCYTHNVTHYSSGLPVNATSETYIAGLLTSSDDSSAIQDALLAQVHAAQALIILNGHVTVLTAPMRHNGQPDFLVSVGDTIDHPHPGAVNGSTFSARFTSIVKTADAETWGLPTSPEDPAQVEGPPTAASAAGADAAAEDNPPNGYERIHWAVANNGDSPVVVVLPVAFPLPYGTRAPIGRNIEEDFTEEEVPYKPLLIWLRAMAYVIKHNNGMSVTGPGTLFPADTFSTDEFGNLTIVEGVLDYPALRMTLPNTPSHAAVCQQMATYDDKFRLEAARGLPEALPAVAAGQPAGQSNLTMETITNLFKAAQGSSDDTATYQEKQAIKSCDDSIRRYRLMGAKLVNGPDGVTTIIPGDLKPDFEDILKTLKSADSDRNFTDSARVACSADRLRDTALSAFGTMKPSSLGPMTIRCLRTFQWLESSPTQDPETLNRFLSIWVFTTPVVQSAEYKDNKAHDERLLAQLSAGEDKSRLARRTTELYIRGQQNSVRDVLAALANIHLIFTIIYEDFEHSILWFSLSQFVTLLRSEQGQSWCQTHQHKPEVFTNLLLDCQHTLSPFVQLAANPKLRTLVATGDALPPELFRAAENQANKILEPLSTLSL
jgi:hypothetical protein